MWINAVVNLHCLIVVNCLSGTAGWYPIVLGALRRAMLPDETMLSLPSQLMPSGARQKLGNKKPVWQCGKRGLPGSLALGKGYQAKL